MSSDDSDRVAIIGAGHAGGTFAATLRQSGWTGGISLIGAEPLPPYQRPPLSKAWLIGEADSASLLLRSANFYAGHDIDLHLADAATAIDMDKQQITLSSGASVGFGKLVLATGARPRLLPVPGADLAGVCYLRTAADADQLKAALVPGRRIVVIGGGYLGLEVAASARKLGVDATVVERLPRLLARVASPEISAFYEDFHKAQGVDMVLGAGVTQLRGEGGRVTGVALDDGRVLAADIVLVSIGATPDDGLARAIGCTVADGIVVDACGQTSCANVYAIGDVTRRPLPIYGAHVARMESVPSAVEQTRLLAHHLTGKAAPAPEVPWFWSDQYDLKLQIAGLALDVQQRLVRGDMAEARFAVFHLGADNAVRAVEAINMPAEFMLGRRLIASRKPVDPALIVDASVTPRQLLA